MHLATLGFLETLQGVLQNIFNNVLMPLLKVLFEALFKLVLELIKPILASIYFQIMVIFLKILDFLAYVFDIFAGVRPVSYNGTPSYFLDVFFGYDPISKAFFYITIFAAVLATIFTIYSVVKSIGDMALENKNPVGVVLRRALRAALIFMMIPLMTLFLLRLTSIMLIQVNQVINTQTVDSSGVPANGGAPGLGALVFLSGSMKAANNTGYNSNPSFTDALRADYLTGDKDYSDQNTVEGDFDLTKFDYITSTCGAIVVSLIMIGALFMFIRRIFDLLILYLTAPIFVAAIPLDDGGAFSKWRELFVAKMFSGFGTVITMKLFFLLIPMIFSADLKLNSNPDVDAALKLFIIIGGAWAAFQSQTTLLHLLSPEAAYAAQESVGIGALVGGMAMSKVGAIGGKALSGGRQSGGRGGQSGGDMESFHRQRQSDGGGAYAPQGAHSAPGGALG